MMNLFRYFFSVKVLLLVFMSVAAAGFAIFQVNSGGAASFLLLEDGTFLLLEDGTKLVLQ